MPLFVLLISGNSTSEKLSDFIDALETSLGIEAQKNFMPMQAGDVLNTWADTSLLEHLTGYKPTTDVRTGVSKFVEWYLSYYKFNPNNIQIVMSECIFLYIL